MKTNHYNRVMACYQTIKKCEKTIVQDQYLKQPTQPSLFSLTPRNKDKILKRTGSEIILYGKETQNKKAKSKKLNRSQEIMNQQDKFSKRIGKCFSQKSLQKSKGDKVKFSRDKPKSNSVGKIPKKSKSVWKYRSEKK